MCFSSALPMSALLIPPPKSSSPNHGSPRIAPFCYRSGAPGEQLPAKFRLKLPYPFVSFSIPLIWGAALLLGLLVAAAVLFAVMAKRKGR